MSRSCARCSCRASCGSPGAGTGGCRRESHASSASSPRRLNMRARRPSDLPGGEGDAGSARTGATSSVEETRPAMVLVSESVASHHEWSKGAIPRVTAAGRREYGLFLAATALIVAHILNDEFLSREPGTSAGDHVLGAAVPIVVALLTAIFYPTVRGGVRGWIAILFGILALTRAVVALLEASSVGLSGDDYTGILLLPAGTVLIAVGAWTLWRSRKTSGSRVRRLLRRALIGFVVVVVGLEVVFPLAYAIFYTHKPRMEVERANLGRPYEEVTLQTSDGLDLAAWYVPSRNGAAV